MADDEATGVRAMLARAKKLNDRGVLIIPEEFSTAPIEQGETFEETLIRAMTEPIDPDEPNRSCIQ